ncbi:MAG: hypothetical protein GY847_37420 [Proteobacteria bacterium]|nr:hypothetical protein [Pseudomonadota bacterium]
MTFNTFDSDANRSPITVMCQLSVPGTRFVSDSPDSDSRFPYFCVDAGHGTEYMDQ